MKTFLLFLGSLILIVFGSCAQIDNTKTDDLLIAEAIIESVDFLDNDFIILKHKEGIFGLNSLSSDTLEFFFNMWAVGFILQKDMDLHYNIDDFLFLDSIGNNSTYMKYITGEWPYKRIGRNKIIALTDLMTINIDSIMIAEWSTFSGFKNKNIMIFSQPIYDKSRKSAFMGVQIYTDSLYYSITYQLSRKEVWQVVSSNSIVQEIIDIRLIPLDDDVGLAVETSVLLGNRK